MTDNKDNRANVKLSESLARELEAAAIEARKTLGRKLTYSEVIETAWDAFKGKPLITNADVEYAVKLLEWLRNPPNPDFNTFTKFVLAEFERQTMGKVDPMYEITRKHGK